MKEELSWKMFQMLEKHVPGISSHIVYWSLGTPLTNEHYINATRGNLYGIAKSPTQVGPGAFPIQSAIPGLYMVGASTLEPRRGRGDGLRAGGGAQDSGLPHGRFAEPERPAAAHLPIGRPGGVAGGAARAYRARTESVGCGARPSRGLTTLFVLLYMDERARTHPASRARSPAGIFALPRARYVY